MANKSSTQLHALIRSLTGAEKRYFKVYAERHQSKGPKNYVLLFDAINEQETYDEEALNRRFQGEAFLKHLSIAKNRLYHQILLSLDAFHAESSLVADLTRRLHYAEILFSKALYGQCRKMLSAVEKSAVEHEQWEILLLVVRRRKRLAEVTQYEWDADEGMEDLLAMERRALTALKIESDLWSVKSRVFRELFTSGQARTESEMAEYAEEVERAERARDDGPMTTRATYLVLHTRSAYHFAAGEYHLCYEALSENRSLLEANPSLIEEEPDAYIAVLTNLIYVAAKLNRFEVVADTLERTRNLPATLTRRFTPDLELRQFVNTYSLELAIANLNGVTDRAEAVLNEISEGLEKWDDKLSAVRKAGFLHGMSALYYLLGNRKKALELNNELLNTIPIDKSEDLYLFAQIFHLILHYDAGHYDLIRYGLKNLQRLLERREKHFEFEAHFLDFLKIAVANPEPGERTSAISQFLAKITPLETRRYEKTAFEYFDFIAWAQAGLNGGDYARHVRERAENKDLL